MLLPPVPFGCQLCEEVRSTLRAMYWHLKIDHQLSHEDAFQTAGEFANERRWILEQRAESGDGDVVAG